MRYRGAGWNSDIRRKEYVMSVKKRYNILVLILVLLSLVVFLGAFVMQWKTVLGMVLSVFAEQADPNGQDVLEGNAVRVIAHVFSLLGCIMMVVIGFIKKKRHMLVAQCGQFGLQSVANLLFGSPGGCVAGIVGIVRIYIFERVKHVSVWLKIGFIALQAVLTAVSIFLYGTTSFMSWLPVLAMTPYTWYLDTKSPVLFKAVNLFGVSIWLVHDIYYQNAVAVFFDSLTFVSTMAGIVLLLIDKIKLKNTKNEVLK
jgi:hypothetical protein